MQKSMRRESKFQASARAALLCLLFVSLSGAKRNVHADSRPSPLATALQQQAQQAQQSQQQAELDRIRRVVDRTLAMTEVKGAAINEWDWEAGVAMAGLMRAVAATGDPNILNAVATWTDARLAEAPKLAHVNHATPAWAALELYEYRPEPRYLDAARRAVDFLMNRAPRVHGSLAHVEDQLWDDTLIVSVPLLARYGATQDCPACLSLAVDEYLAHARRLQDPATGRWYHGWDLSGLRAGIQPHLSAAQWARGNGWTALAATELLTWLPEDHPYRAEVRQRLERQLVGLVTLQDRGGLWHTVVTRPDFYLESSGSAAISAAILRATAAGWIDPRLRPFGEAGQAAVEALVASDGTLTRVSTGTGVAPSLEVYNQVPFDQIKPYGQGLYLIMAEAGLR
jgi:unsaturated rhamnogalacturonyl hydrolase